jgi:prolyl-tRNA editing enzyme YbaK/EbsC (Cys-tRNA(Pro) deacylase)
MDGESLLPPVVLSPSAQKVQRALEARGFPYRVVELDVPVRTAADAARAVGSTVAQIAKCVVFRAARSGRPVLVVTSGAHRVDETRIAALLGEPLAKADPDFVRAVTGFGIGGVPPLGHAVAPEAFVDEDLLRHPVIWAAAGHPNSLFRLDPADLPRMTGGRVVGVR